MPKVFPVTYKFCIQGMVQGVGFRPFVYRVAKKCGILGYVCNTTSGVTILAQGSKKALEDFEKALETPPSVAKITKIIKEKVEKAELFLDFHITHSLHDHALTALIPADIALCETCLSEMRNPKDRRFGYAFISCTNCGGRYSLIQSLPYDRSNTAMAGFTMCAHCKGEYEDPNSRRFHSEINCCQTCGPKLFFTEHLANFTHEEDSKLCEIFPEAFADNPLERAIELLKRGKILALKGIGGYALVCNGLDAAAIASLRTRKRRPRKPLALMCKNMEMVESYVSLSAYEKEVLCSKIAPILLCQIRKNTALPLEVIAPNLATLGVILPYAPLHYLLLEQVDFPLIFTSANLSGEPIIKDLSKLSRSLANVCDGVLLYNRDILNPIDDSLVCVHNGRMQVLRRARGFSCALDLPLKSKGDFISLGAQQKATFCLKTQNKILLSPHLGDLESVASVENFLAVQKLFLTQHNSAPKDFVVDLHPHFIQRSFLNKTDRYKAVQHHFAHLLANVAENGIHTRVLGVIFDGTGYGEGGKIWGGEFLEWNPQSPLEYKRVAYCDDFALLGGERAIRDIRRIGVSLVFESFKDGYQKLPLEVFGGFSWKDLELFYHLSAKQSSSTKVLCNSIGRLFDGVSALCGACVESSYEGEGGMVLESLGMQALKGIASLRAYPYHIQEGVVHYQKMVQEICQDIALGREVSVISLRFHMTLTEIIAEVARDYHHIALGGGCFQNMLLMQLVLKKLEDKVVYCNQEIPCNDGGISVGQAYFMDLFLANS